MSEQLFLARSSAPGMMFKSATYNSEHYCIIYIPSVISLLSCGPVEYSRGGGTRRMLMSGQLLRAKTSAFGVMTKPKYFCFTYTTHGFSAGLQHYGTQSWLGHVRLLMSERVFRARASASGKMTRPATFGFGYHCFLYTICYIFEFGYHCFLYTICYISVIPQLTLWKPVEDM